MRSAVTRPLTRLTSRAVAFASAEASPPARDADALTEPPPSPMPFGVCDGALRLASWSPDARTWATVPSVPLTTAARARAVAPDWAPDVDARIASIAAAAASAPGTRNLTLRVCHAALRARRRPPPRPAPPARTRG